MKRILLSGCSFSFGDELEWQHVEKYDGLTQFDLGDRSIRSEREQKRYSNLLAKHYNCEVINKSKCGASNQWILRTLAESKNSAKWTGQKYDLVIFQLTEPSRIDIEHPERSIQSISATNKRWNRERSSEVRQRYSKKTLLPDLIDAFVHKEEQNKRWDIRKKELQEIADAYYLHVYSEILSLENWWLHQYAFKHMFRDIPYVIMGKRPFENTSKNEIAYKDRSDTVDFFLQGENNLLGSTRDFGNPRYCKRYDLKGGVNRTGGHPSALGHELIAKKIIEVVNEKYPDLG